MDSNEFCVLVDRAENDQHYKREIMHNSRARNLPAGEREIIVPTEVATFLLRYNTQHHIHTTDGRYMCRFAIKQPTEELVQFLGEECGDLTPIERDHDAIEGWDSEAQAALRGQTRTVSVRLQSLQQTNQGNAGSRIGAGER